MGFSFHRSIGRERVRKEGAQKRKGVDSRASATIGEKMADRQILRLVMEVGVLQVRKE